MIRVEKHGDGTDRPQRRCKEQERKKKKNSTSDRPNTTVDKATNPLQREPLNSAAYLGKIRGREDGGSMEKGRCGSLEKGRWYVDTSITMV